MANVSNETAEIFGVAHHELEFRESTVSPARRIADITLALAALPIVAGVSLIILMLNWRYNPGPLFFSQIRMGAHGSSFRMWKFRTMLEASGVRGPDDAVEEDRITRLGRVMRRTRLDELPNFYNVLLGEMSFIGPRPDAWDHAIWHREHVPYYAERFRIAPGITGLAQVRNGYADSVHAVRKKARLDAFYVRHQCLKLDLFIVLSTFRIVFTGEGAK